MNKLFLIISIIMASLAFQVHASEKEYKKIIEKYDVPEAVRLCVGIENSKSFWDALVNQNPRLEKLFNDIQKMKGAEKEALSNISRMSIYNPTTDPDVIHSWDSTLDLLREDMGIPENYCSVHLYDDNSMNAATGLTVDKRFAVLINGGMIDVIENNLDLLYAVLAHEMAHGMLFHHLDTEYSVAKKKRKDKLLAGIAAGLNAVAAASELYTAAQYGVKPSGVDYGENIKKIGDDLKKSEYLFRYKYQRGNEYEADLVAYRFMDQIMGNGEKYIELLNLIGHQSPINLYESEDSDHPSIDQRIGVLKYAAQHPEIVNEEDKKILLKIEKSAPGKK